FFNTPPSPSLHTLSYTTLFRSQAGARDRRPRPPRAPARGADQPRRRHGARAGHSPAAAAPVARMTNAETNAEILAASAAHEIGVDRKSTRLNSSHVSISYAVFC